MLERSVDLVSLAQTGTGKTAAFGVPLIQRTDNKSKKTQTLVLCPTRELCVQVARDLESYSKFVKGLKVLPIYGGSSIDLQIRALRKGVQMIVATPGRLNDLIRRRCVDISNVQFVVFDEADEMLQMGFQEELNAILEQTPDDKNTLLFSATMSREVKNIANRYMSDPVEMTIGKLNAGAENVRHEYYMVQARDRYPALKRIVDNCPSNYSIIFCRTRRETNEIANKLMQDGYNADALHGDLSQAQRDQVMKKFRSKSLQILVATDVAARGLDVNDLTHVINYNLPDDVSNYTHRSGRTGRAGRTGISVVLVQARERFRIKQIENKIKKKFKQCLIPTGAEICKTQLVSQVEVVTNVEVDHEQIDPLYAEIAEKFAHLDREELIKKFISQEFNRFLAYYKNAPDLNAKANQQPGRRNERQQGKFSRQSGDSSQFTRFFLNVGRRDGIMPQGLLGKLNDASGGGRIKVGKIDIMRNSALIEAESRFTPQILSAFQHVKINGKPVSIEIARESSGGGQGRPKQKRGGKRMQSKRRFKTAQ
jgi:ATP-dependent RNA helicase DeaD